MLILEDTITCPRLSRDGLEDWTGSLYEALRLCDGATERLRAVASRRGVDPDRDTALLVSGLTVERGSENALLAEILDDEGAHVSLVPISDALRLVEDTMSRHYRITGVEETHPDEIQFARGRASIRFIVTPSTLLLSCDYQGAAGRPDSYADHVSWGALTYRALHNLVRTGAAWLAPAH